MSRRYLTSWICWSKFKARRRSWSRCGDGQSNSGPNMTARLDDVIWLTDDFRTMRLRWSRINTSVSCTHHHDNNLSNQLRLSQPTRYRRNTTKKIATSHKTFLWLGIFILMIALSIDRQSKTNPLKLERQAVSDMHLWERQNVSIERSVTRNIFRKQQQLLVPK